MIQFELSSAASEALEERLRALKPDKLATVISRASNRAALKVRTEGWRNIKSVYTIKRDDVFNRITLLHSRMGTTVWVRGPFEGAEHFKTSYSKRRGLSLSVKQGKPANVRRSFRYNTTYFKRDGTRRLPISRVKGPSVTQMFQNEKVSDRLQEVGMETYMNEMQRQIDLILRGLA